MKTLPLLWALFCALVLTFRASGQSPETKASANPTADAAATAFFNLCKEKNAKLDQARFQKLIGGGLGFISEYPTHEQTNNVIAALVSFGATMRDPSLAATRTSWMQHLNYEIFNRKFDPKLTADGKAAFAALDATLANYLFWERPSKENAAAYRDKIDTLAQLPAGERFLGDQELYYLQILERMNPLAAEAHARKLTGFADKEVAAIAADRLNILEARKRPYELNFVALDGRAVDLAQLRGKAVLLVFWSTDTKGVKEELSAIKKIHATYQKKGFEVVGVACGKEADREAYAKFISEQKLPWPQYFDGKELANDFGPKLNVRSLPAAVLFDQKGMLVTTGAQAKTLEPQVKALLGIKDAAPPEPEPPMSSGKRR